MTTAQNTEGGAAVTLGRVLLVALAMGVGALGYRDHFGENPVWWHWAGELAAGAVLLGVALWQAPEVTEASWRRVLRWLAGAVALAAGAAAIQLFPQPGREVETATAIGVALIAFVLARWVPFAFADVQALVGDTAEARPRSTATTIRAVVLTVAAIAANVTAAYLNREQHLAAFLTWLASLALLVAATWRRSTPAESSRPARWTTEGGPELSPRAAALTLLLILILAAALRMIALRDIPAVIDPDEGRQGRWAERIWHDGFPDAFGLGWNVFPNLSYMTEYVWVQALGTSNPHLRLSAATIGVLSLVPVFFWVRRWWGNVIALMAVFLLAINREHIAWSRLGLNNMQQVLVAGLMLAAFARVLRTRRAVDWVWFGLATGLAFHTYHAAKLFAALLAVVAVLFALGSRGFLRRYAAGAAVGALAWLLCVGPLAVTVYKDWEQFYGGTSNRVDLAHLTDAYRRHDVQEVRNYIHSHVIGCLYSFISNPRERHGPTFDPFVAVPFLLGVGWMLWCWRDPRHLVVLVWTIGILVIGGMITDYPPWKARLLGYLPMVCLIPAVIAGRLRGLLSRWSPARGDLAMMPVLLLWLGAALQYNWYTIFIFWPQAHHGDIMTEICRAIDNAPLPATLYMAGGGVMAEPKVASNDCMIAPNPERFIVNLPDDPAIVPLPPTHRGNAVLLVSWMQQELLPLVRHYYPHAKYQLIYDQIGSPVLHVLTLHDDAIWRSRGLRATYRSPARTWTTPEGSDVFKPPADATFPLSAVWRGLVFAATPGEYAVRSDAATLKLDDRPVVAERPVTLAAGWHAIEMRAEFKGSQEVVALQWRPPGAVEWAAIPRAWLNTHPEAHGLLGRYFARSITDETAKPIAAAPDYTRLDNAISFDFYSHFDEKPVEPFAARPSTMEWTGTVELPEGTVQGLRLEATTPTQVFLNGALALAAPGEREGHPVTTELTGITGRVPIRVRTVRPADDNPEFWKLRLLWRAPGGNWTAFVDYRPAAG